MRYISIKGFDEKIKAFQTKIIKNKNPYDLLKMACLPGADIESLEDAIIKTRDPKYVYYFAQNIKGVKIAKL